MNKFNWNKEDIPYYIILISAPILLTLYLYYAQACNFSTYFPIFSNDFYPHLLQFISFFILIFVAPIIYSKFALHKSLDDLGFSLRNKKIGIKICIFSLPIVVLIVFFASNILSLQQEYPLSKAVLEQNYLIVWYELIYIIFYYIAWEFYFRGFLLFTLEGKFGSIFAILIQTILSSLIHLGKPDGEMWGAILAGIIFGAIAIYTRSFWYTFFIHATIGVLTDLAIILRLMK